MRAWLIVCAGCRGDSEVLHQVLIPRAKATFPSTCTAHSHADTRPSTNSLLRTLTHSLARPRIHSHTHEFTNPPTHAQTPATAWRSSRVTSRASREQSCLSRPILRQLPRAVHPRLARAATATRAATLAWTRLVLGVALLQGSSLTFPRWNARR
jgi:hypothetical protein